MNDGIKRIGWVSTWNSNLVYYPVSVNIGGRVWIDDEIIINVNDWNVGVRTYRYNSNRDGMHIVKPDSKLESNIQRMIDALEESVELKRERREMMRRLIEIENRLHDIASEEITIFC